MRPQGNVEPGARRRSAMEICKDNLREIEVRRAKAEEANKLKLAQRGAIYNEDGTIRYADGPSAAANDRLDK